MTDFAKLMGQPAAIDESLEAFEFAPDGFENGSGDPLKLTMHPGGGTRFKKAVRIMQVKVSRAKTGDEVETELTDAEIEAELLKADGRTAEILARCCDGWNMTDGKEPIPFNLANVTAMFTAVEPLRNITDEEMTARGKSLKAKKSA